MKVFVRTLVALALFALALNGAALAQDAAHKVRAQVPFNFYVGEKMLPAGIYTFAFDGVDYNVLVRASDKGGAAFLLGSPEDASTNNLVAVTFRTDGEGVYVLQKVQGPDFGIHFNAEKTLAHVVENQPPYATRTVVAELVK